MRKIQISGRAVTKTLALAAAASFLACGDVKTALLEAPIPTNIDPSSVQSAAGANAVRLGALNRLRNSTGGSESTWLFGGLLADEWSTSSTFVQNDEADERQISPNNSTIIGQLRRLEQVIQTSNQALVLMNRWLPCTTATVAPCATAATTGAPPAQYAEMYFARGFAEMQLALDFCNGIPISDSSGVFVFGKPLPDSTVFQMAVASFDSARKLVTGLADTASVNAFRAASIGEARAMVALSNSAANLAAAAALVAGIPSTYAYNTTYAVVGDPAGDNILWDQPASQRRYTVGDSLEGNAHNLDTKNGLPFGSAKDPRLPVSYTISAKGDTTKSQDGFTFSRTTSLYAVTTNVAVVNGIDARMVEAESQLAANNFSGAGGTLSILNALRAAPPNPIGALTVAAMTALTDPGAASNAYYTGSTNQDYRINLLFREKAFWTFSRGQRLGDLRRLIRQYGRTQDKVFPVGNHYRGTTYGTDVNLPVVQDEVGNNPLVSKVCTDRNA